MALKIIDTGKRSAQENMDIDAGLLKDLGDEPILHIYEWDGPSATHGHFIKPADYLDLTAAQNNTLQLGRRPTGGGIIFHVSDWAFSILIPSSHPKFSLNTLDNYHLINTCVQDAVKVFLGSDANLLPSEPIPLDESCRNFCMAKPTKYDVMLGSQKIAGSAQRRVRGGFLHQGSICVAHPPKVLLEDVLLPGTQVLTAMEQNTFSLLGGEASRSALAEARNQVKNLLTHQFETQLA